MASDYKEYLRAKWAGLRYPDSGYLRLNVHHPLEWNLGRSTAGEKALVIICSRPLKNLPSSRSICARCGKREDGKYAISFLLTDDRQEDVFLAMGSDLIEYSANGNEIESLRLVGIRYGQWCRLLARKGRARLTTAEQKGLIGELLFLQMRLVQESADNLSILEGWSGPEDGDQDFVYSTKWYEIKTTGRSSENITISSAEQLDAEGIGELVVFRVDSCAPEQPGAFTLPGLIEKISEYLKADPGAEACFEDKLEKAGYMELPEYAEEYWSCGGNQQYVVDDSFPRICRHILPQEIVRCAYTLSLPGIAAWLKQR